MGGSAAYIAHRGLRADRLGAWVSAALSPASRALVGAPAPVPGDHFDRRRVMIATVLGWVAAAMAVFIDEPAALVALFGLLPS